VRSKFGQSIREARRAAGLTQHQLGMRLGLKGRAISRWERADNTPTKRNLKALVTAINAVDQSAASKLASAMGSDPRATALAIPAAEAPIPAPIGEPATFELAIFSMADELDLPPRRIRGALARLLKRLRTTHLSLEDTQHQLDAWIAKAP
jgi:transcriptional regulator with XRE-family HTH domain